MRSKFGAVVATFLLVPFVAACENDPTAPADDQPHFEATVSGAHQAGYNGTGEFFVTNNLREGGVTDFALSSTGVGASAGQRFMLFQRGDGVPEVGTYPMGVSFMSDANAEGFTAVFAVEGEMHRYFASSSGQLVITHSTPEYVRGTFSFTAFQYCAVEQATGDVFGPCAIPDAPLSGVPTVEISGSFVAHEGDPTAIPL